MTDWLSESVVPELPNMTLSLAHFLSLLPTFAHPCLESRACPHLTDTPAIQIPELGQVIYGHCMDSSLLLS